MTIVVSETTAAAECPVCASPASAPFVRIADQPVHCNVLWDTHAEAVASPVGDIDLVFCSTCGHVFNVAFDPERTTYGGTYENSLHHSGVFQEYAIELVDSLIARHDLRGAEIVEIGAGQGDFLAMLCERGGNRGTGFDPSHVGPTELSDAVRVVRAFYGPEFSDHPADLIVCRHVLEHIAAAGEFVGTVRAAVADRSAVVFFEVPNALWTLVEGGVWDIIYEHCGYFTPTSLSEVFRRSGFDVGEPQTVFGGQFLTIEGSPSAGRVPSPPTTDVEVAAVGAATRDFADAYEHMIGTQREVLGSLTSEGRSAVIWGAGSKGVTFLNVVDRDRVIDRAVDLNPRKHGMHVAGSGQVIVGPEELVDEPPDVVFVMNPNYRSEIEATVAELGLRSELVVV